jgi:hypothetical protein
MLQQRAGLELNARGRRRTVMSYSYRHLRLFWLAALAVMPFTSAVNATTYSITSIATRTGVTVPVMIIDKSADTPPAVGTLIMFTGGNGQLNLLTNWPTDQSGLQTHDTDSSANFLVRQRNNFADTGPFNIILMDVPSDQSGGYSTTPDFRKSQKHQFDIAKVIGYARQTFGAGKCLPGLCRYPVWLVGTSRGSTSSVKGALLDIQQPGLDSPDGFVVTSTVTESSDYDNVLAMDLKDIDLSAMMVADTGDICALTPPIGVNEIARRLLSTPDFRGLFVTNTTSPVDPSDTCDATGYHGFSNAEDQVVTPVSRWILDHLP